MADNGLSVDDKMTLFVAALKEWGTVKKACELTDITRRTYNRWLVERVGFTEKVKDALDDFADSWEDICIERVKNPTRHTGSDSLAFNMLVGLKRNKYGAHVIVENDAGKVLLDEFRKQVKKEKEHNVEHPEELSEPIERTLEEVLQQRSNPPEANGYGGEEEEAETEEQG